jgi:MFS family permease
MSLCGTWMQGLAQSWLVYRLTGSALLLGLVAFVSQIPVLALGVWGGVIADRLPRRNLLVATQTLSLLQAASLAALTLSGHITVHWIFFLSGLLGLINAVDMPVRQAFVAELVPRDDLPSAIGLNSSIFNAARIVGPSIAGILVATVGEGICFLVNALTFLAVIGCLLAIRLAPKPPVSPQSAWGLLVEGLSYARHTPHVRAVLGLVAVLSLTAMPFTVLLPVFAGDVLHSGPHALGILMAATGIGALAGALRIAQRTTVRGLGKVIAQAGVIFGVSLLAFAASAVLWLSTLTLILVGYGMITVMAACNTLLQSLVPDNLRGRVMSLYTLFFLGVAPIGSLLAGAWAASFGAPLAVAAGGAAAVAAAVFFARALPDIRRHIRDHGLLPPEELRY